MHPSWISPEWANVIVAAVYVVVAIFTLRAIHRQADIAEKQSRDAADTANTAKKAATAARDSADALISAERPWILLVEASIIIRNTLRSDDDPKNGPRHHYGVSFVIKNSGKTPALVHKFTGGLDFVRGNLAHVLTSYDEPFEGQPDRIMAPGQESSNIKFMMTGELPPGAQPYQRDSSDYFLGYGEVDYSDIFGKKHVSRFCYIYDAKSVKFRYLCHNPSHNDYT